MNISNELVRKTIFWFRGNYQLHSLVLPELNKALFKITHLSQLLRYSKIKNK